MRVNLKQSLPIWTDGMQNLTLVTLLNGLGIPTDQHYTQDGRYAWSFKSQGLTRTGIVR